ncbi:hypothetical protein Dimus_006544 [Dionaea muscipula]
MSVKELMEEEMISEQNQKKHANTAEEEPKQTVPSNNGVYAKKIHRRMNKKSFDLGSSEEPLSEKIAYQKHRTSRSLDLSLMIEELCSQIPMKHSKQDSDSEFVPQPRQDSSAIEQHLGEATKVFIDHFSNEKSFRKDGKIQPSKELLDALHALNSNKEIFLKILQDPDSQLLLLLQKLMKDEDSKQFLEQVVGNCKQDNFFWRKFKGLERSLSKRNDSSQDLSTIVVLKPGPLGSYKLETPSTSNDDQIQKGFRNFTFSEFKRRLKLAVGKELQDCRDVGKANGGEIGGNGIPSPRSPRKDHFFIEKVPKPLSGTNKGDHLGKPMESGPRVERGTSYTAEQRVSDIYIEAKKHLAEIVGSSDVDSDFSSIQVPRSLGKILSFPDYSSPVCSPRLGGDHGFPAIQRRLTPCHESQHAEENACHQAQEVTAGIQEAVKQKEGQDSLNQGVESRIGEDKLVDEASAELNHDNGAESEGIFLSGECAVVMEVFRSSDAEFEQKSNQLAFSSAACSTISPGEAEVVDSLHNFEEKGQFTSLELDTLEASSSSAMEVKDLDGTIDGVHQASPVSVLDPIYKEDDVSPPSTKSLSTIEPIQPRQIQFEEPPMSPPLPDRFAYINCSGEDKKSMFEFVKVVVQKSGLTWDELLRRSLLSDHILKPTLFDEVEFLQDRLCDDPKLIFDLVQESVQETGLHYLGPNFSFRSVFVSPEVKGKDIFAETWEGVDRHFKLEEGLPRNLEQIVAIDYTKDRHWMDLRHDIDNIGVEIEETIFEELIDDTILHCIISSGKKCDLG